MRKKVVSVGKKKNFAGVWRIKQRGCSLLTEMSQITHKDGFGVFTACAKLQEGKEKSEGEGREEEGEGEDERLHIYKEYRHHDIAP